MLNVIKLLFYIELLLGSAVTIFYFSLKPASRKIIKPGYVAMILLIPLVGLFGGSKYIFYGFVFALPLTAIGKPQRLACVYILALPLFPPLAEPVVIGSVYIAGVSAIAALNLGLIVALAFTPTKRSSRRIMADVSIWIVFLVILLSNSHGIPLNAVLREIALVFLDVVPPFYVMARCVRSPEHGGDVGLFLSLSACCNALVAIFESKRSWPLFEGFNQGLHVDIDLSASLLIRSGFMRAQGAIGDPATLSLLMALAMVVCSMLRPRFSRAGYWVIMTLLAIALVVSQSRGGWAAAAVGVALFWLYERRTAALATFVGLAALGGLVVLAVPADSKVGQILGRSGDAQSTATYRSDLFSRGIEEVRDKPIVGHTGDELEVSLDDLRQGQHIIDFVNTHLYVALKIGLIGLACWLLAWGIPVTMAWRGRAAARRARDPVTLAMPVAMLGACFTALTFTSMIDRMPPFTAVSFGLVSAFLAFRHTRGLPPTARP